MTGNQLSRRRKEKGKENKKPEAPAADGEKSDTQKKRDAKKAEKANKKAAHKSSEADDKTEAIDDGPDISSGKYGVQEMNQSKEKPSTVLTPVKELGMKMNEKMVTIRGRLHTSRAKGLEKYWNVLKLILYDNFLRQAVLFRNQAAAGDHPVLGLCQ